jgi:hypothetical protein
MPAYYNRYKLPVPAKPSQAISGFPDQVEAMVHAGDPAAVKLALEIMPDQFE